jgi:hypothetical protein
MSCLAPTWHLSDCVDEDADAVGEEVPGDWCAEGNDDDVSVGLVIEDHLLGFLDAQPHYLRPRRLLLAAASIRRRGAHLHAHHAAVTL